MHEISAGGLSLHFDRLVLTFVSRYCASYVCRVFVCAHIHTCARATACAHIQYALILEQQTPFAQGLSVGSLLAQETDDKGACLLGRWSITRGDKGTVRVTQQTTKEQVVLMSNGIAYFGGGNRACLISDGDELKTLSADELRETLGIVRPEEGEMSSAAGGTREVGGGRVARIDVPEELLCPILGDLMEDPWIAADGFSYEVCTSLCLCICALAFVHLCPSVLDVSFLLCVRVWVCMRVRERDIDGWCGNGGVCGIDVMNACVGV